MRLPVPRPVQDRYRYNLATRFSITFHYGAHVIEMFFAPKWNIVESGYRIRILPQIKMKFPVLRLGKHSAGNRYFIRQWNGFHPFAAYFELRFIRSGSSIRRNPYVNPYGTDWVCFYRHGLRSIQNIGYYWRIPFGLIVTIAATAFFILVKFIGHYIPYKRQLYRRRRNNWVSLFKRRWVDCNILNFLRSIKNSLSVYTLPAPCFCFPFFT